MAEKMRVHILAKELSVPSKTIVEKCKAEGIGTVKNHMSTLSAGLHATIREWFSEGRHNTTIETAQRVDLEEIRIKSSQAAIEQTVTGETLPNDASATTTIDAAAPGTMLKETSHETVVDEPGTPIATPSIPSTEPTDVETPTVLDSPVVPVVSPPAAYPEKPPEKIEETPTQQVAAKPLPSIPKPDAPKKPLVPAGPQNIPAAAKLRGPRVVRYEAPEYNSAPPRSRAPRPTTPAPSTLGGPPPPAAPADTTDKTGRRKGRFAPRRSTGHLKEAGEKLAEWRDRDLAERRERLAGATGRRIHRRRTAQISGGGHPAAAGPKTRATVHEPIRMKELCSETGINFLQLFKVLRSEHNVISNVNMTLDTETAQLVSLNFGIELEVIPARTALDELQDEFAKRERKNLKERPPVVTMLGHVDHGKTSLLDAIRKTDIAAGEDGGITQHISSYHIQTPHGKVTFLDTPGHEAFTEMRARGAQMTDVVVLLVAADDGLMPQTIEAIRHAQAAEVPIVVALNKIDLGDQNRPKIYGQLAEHGLTPSGDWGGETDVIDTSATKGQGVRELVEHLAELSGLLELKSDATLPATGTVIEAETKSSVGPVATVLVQEGTLSIGDVVVCGNAFGKVRALHDDRGQHIESAGPSIPVEVWGLDRVPAAGDRLYAVENLQRAKLIASETQQARIEVARAQSRKVKTLEEMFKQRDSDEIPELNVIIKADVDGSVAALRKSLIKIPSDEVQLTIRHAAVGPVNDSDALLASTCNGIVIAFRVEIPTATRRIAEQHGVDVRPYLVIYDVCDDVRQALSGLLTPEERIESRATVEVRQVFRVSKAGMVAGSFVTQGVVNRKHRAKILREGVLVRDNCTIASLKHFKDDVKEVRSGLECGIRLEGFDDVHVGDIIETYEIVQIPRTL